MPRCLTVAGFFAQLRPRALTAEQLRPPSRAVPNYLLLAAGNLTGTCGEVLTTRGAPSGAWLFSVSISRMNFSASMGVASLIVSRRQSNYGPRWGDPGAVCLPAANGDQRQTGYYYLSIRSRSCYCAPMICFLAPEARILFFLVREPIDERQRAEAFPKPFQVLTLPIRARLAPQFRDLLGGPRVDQHVADD